MMKVHAGGWIPLLAFGARDILLPLNQFAVRDYALAVVAALEFGPSRFALVAAAAVIRVSASTVFEV